MIRNRTYGRWRPPRLSRNRQLDTSTLFAWSDTAHTRASEAANWDPRTATFQGVGEYTESHVAPAIDTWGTVGTPVFTTGVADPDGGTDAVSIEDNDSGALEYVAETLPAGPSMLGLSRHQMWVKQNASGPIIEWQVDASSGATLRLQMDPADGSTALRSASGSTATLISTSASEDAPGWYLWTVILNSTAADSTPRYLIYPAVNTAGSALGGVSLAAVGTNTFYRVAASTTDAYLTDDTLRVMSDGAALYEESRTNEVTDSIDFSSGSSWTLSGSVTTAVSAVTAPDGGVCYELTDAAAGDIGRIQRVLGTIATGDLCASVFIQKNTTPDSFPMVFLGESTATFTGGTVKIRVDPSDGSTSTVSGSPTNVTVADAGDDWWRLSFVVDVTASGAPIVRLYPAAAATLGGSDSLGETGTLAFWGAQVEAGSFVTSPIRTSGAAATRASEYSTLPSASVPSALLDSPWSMRVQAIQSSATLAAVGTSANLFAFDTGGFTDRSYFYDVGSDNRFRVQESSSNVVDITTNLQWNRLDLLTLTFDPPAGEVTFEGLTSGDGTYSGTAWAWSSGDDLIISGHHAHNDFWNGLIHLPEAA